MWKPRVEFRIWFRTNGRVIAGILMILGYRAKSEEEKSGMSTMRRANEATYTNEILVMTCRAKN
jgi:hypothetical protein